MKGLRRQKTPRWTVFALAIAAGTLSAPAEEKKPGVVAGELGGYFVRVKSDLSGEKELYYDKDGTLRSSIGDGLLGGDFSLDESLLSDDADFGFPVPAEPRTATPAEKNPARSVSADDGAGTPQKTRRTETPVPATPDSSEKSAPAPAARAPAEQEGTVDEDSALRKLARERSLENYANRKVLDMEVTDRYGNTLSFRDWQGGGAFGMRRFSDLREGYEMRAAGTDSRSVEFGLFEPRVSFDGAKMFVRRDNGVVEVRLNERFSASPRVFSNERAKTVRESSGFSMQDINRYQFRRNRSSDPGLPVVSPKKSGEVRREPFGGNADLTEK